MDGRDKEIELAAKWPGSPSSSNHSEYDCGCGGVMEAILWRCVRSGIS